MERKLPLLTDYEKRVLEPHGLPKKPERFELEIDRHLVEALDFVHMLREEITLQIPVTFEDKEVTFGAKVFRVGHFHAGTLVYLEPLFLFRDQKHMPMVLLWIPRSGTCGIL